MNKININKWLNTDIKYSDDKIKDIINLLFNDILSCLDNYNDIDFINHYNLFDDFCIHFYNEYVYPYNKINIVNIDDKDYIEMFCEQDIIDIFSYYKNNFNIFPGKSTSYPLLSFVVNNCCVYDIQSEDESSDIDDIY